MSRMPSATPVGTPGLNEVLHEIESKHGWVSNALEALGHAPQALRHFAALDEYVRAGTTLPQRIRELAILTIVRRCEYAWTHHIEVAREAGVSESEILQVWEGWIPDSCNREERAALECVHAFLLDRRMSDAQFREALDALRPRGLTELTLLIGYYRTLVWTAVAFGVELEPREQLEQYWERERRLHASP